MNKLLPAFALLMSVQYAQAQCTPDMSHTSPGLYPTIAENFAPATVGVPYSQTITVIIPADTTIEIIPGVPTTVPINDVTVNNVMGLPSGFSYACNVTGCIFPGGSTNCAVITGTATAGQEGTYPISIAVTYDAGLTADDTVTGYELRVDPAVGVFEISRSRSGLKSSAAPNPFVGNTEISFTPAVACDVKISVFNVLGKVMKTEQVKAVAGENTYTLRGANLQPGVYLVEISDGKNKTTQRLIKQ